MGGRHNDILELLQETQEYIKFLRNQQERARFDEMAIALSKPKIKSALEHLRSCLDYCALELSETVLGTSPRKKVYFPYGEDEEKFKSSLNNNLRGLSGNFLVLIESIQPYRCGDSWLIELCHFTNYNKHKALQKQRRENQGSVTTKVGGLHVKNSNVQIIGFCIGDEPVGSLIITNELTAEQISMQLQNLIEVEREHERVIFREQDSGTDLIELIEKAHAEISLLVIELEKELDAIR